MPQYNSVETLAVVRKVFSYIGPGMVVAVGYMDPGNWATDLAGGANYQYVQLFVVLFSNFFAMLLQFLCVKLGVMTNLDLAQACRRHFHPYVNLTLYIFCEIAIIACDLAEVIGSAIGLQLLFGCPLPWGVAVTGLDVFLIMFFWGKKNTIRYFEITIIILVSIVAFCFFALVSQSPVNWGLVGWGILPNAGPFKSEALFTSLGIMGAIIMPHNLYLHSHLVKLRSPANNSRLTQSGGSSSSNQGEKHDNVLTTWLQDKETINGIDQIRSTVFFSAIDSTVALMAAFFVNASILIVSAANFYGSGEENVGDIGSAYTLLYKYLGPSSAVCFAVALLCSGQSSTFTGTLAGQIVMEGFLGDGFKMAPWLRRLITRIIALIPALVTAIISGQEGISKLLVLSQVILSVQLPFAIWPLIYFTSSRAIMNKKLKVPCMQTSTPLASKNLEQQAPNINVIVTKESLT